MNKKQLRDLIERTLFKIGLKSDSAVILLMGTAAQESNLGEYIRQVGNGPALGVFQMEPETFKDIVTNYLQYRPELAKNIMAASGINAFRSEYLEYNLVLAICMCRVHYLRVPEAIPGDLNGWANYWKKYYNTPKGKGTVGEFVENYKRYVL